MRRRLTPHFLPLLCVALFPVTAVTAEPADPKAELKATADSGPVEEELKGPDGCSVQLGDPENWKLICIGTAPYDFNDPDEIKDATRVATMDAKAALARFLNERLSTTENMEKIVTKQAEQASGQDRKVSKASMTTQITRIKSAADAILRGVIVLESEQLWMGNGGTVRVKVGQSQKTIAVADLFAIENGRAPGAAPGEGGDARTGAEGTPAHTVRKSGGDF